jgi:hypothetical protein
VDRGLCLHAHDSWQVRWGSTNQQRALDRARTSSFCAGRDGGGSSPKFLCKSLLLLLLVPYIYYLQYLKQNMSTWAGAVDRGPGCVGVRYSMQSSSSPVPALMPILIRCSSTGKARTRPATARRTCMDLDKSYVRLLVRTCTCMHSHTRTLGPSGTESYR